jgi:hypothetical protein
MSTSFAPHISNHAIKRAKERLSWNEKTLTRMYEKAHASGIKRSKTTGQLKKFLDSKCIPNQSEAVVYGDVAYFFKGKVLTTVFQIPQELNKVAKKQKRVKVKPVRINKVSSEPYDSGEIFEQSVFDTIVRFLLNPMIMQMPSVEIKEKMEDNLK